MVTASRGLVALLALSALAVTAQAAPLRISPMLLELPAGSSAVLSLANTGSQSTRYQVTGSVWREADNGQMLLEPTRDLVVFPSVFTLGGGEKRDLRVSVRGAAAPLERPYRVVIEQLPGAPEEGISQVAIRTSLTVPVFVAPTRRVVKARVTALERNGRNFSFRLENSGTVRLRLKRISLRALDQAGAPVFEKEWHGWYLLAGGQRGFEVELPGAGCETVASIAVEAVAETGTFREAFRPSAGACG
jgi:fimbrial chaperone protein